ncbi:MAG TPA: S8 family serine peptidase [Longimicrobium sp.]|nr:S8 family serine peptidase [Longimicrobium sp.]
MALPKENVRYPELAKIQILTLSPGDDLSEFEGMLRDDTEHIEYVHRPAVRYPLSTHLGFDEFDPDDPQWGLAKCGFRDVWDTLETSPTLKPIGIIDKGGNKGHKELAAKFLKTVPRGGDGQSDANHATSVAGVIAAARGDEPIERLVGCCSADLHLYNVWRHGKFNPCGYYRALRAVADDQLPVVNLSIGWICEDKTEQEHIRVCRKRGVVVVAAMGNRGKKSPPFYPAAYDDVVAVGGVNASDQPVASSSWGSHMWISAPGERILTVNGESGYHKQDGTSFAAPFVTAAVWLARRYRPCLNVDQVREVLKQSVAPDTVPRNKHKCSSAVGHGRLDMRRMVEVLNTIQCPRGEGPEPRICASCPLGSTGNPTGGSPHHPGV